MRSITFTTMVSNALAEKLAGQSFEKKIARGSIGPFARIVMDSVVNTAKTVSPEQAIQLALGKLPLLVGLADLVKKAGYTIEAEKGKAGVFVSVYGPRDAAQAAELAADLKNGEKMKHVPESVQDEMREIVKAGGARPLLAHGFSKDEEDALLHAVGGAVNEEYVAAMEAARKEAAQKIATEVVEVETKAHDESNPAARPAGKT